MNNSYSYKINGVTLTMSDMARIYEFFRIASTAESIVDNYGIDKDSAFNYAVQVRKNMDKYGVSEEEAIDMLHLSKIDEDDEE